MLTAFRQRGEHLLDAALGDIIYNHRDILYSPAAMNYQHAFHAGNFADVHKHVVLTRILVHLRQKAAAFRVIDTHAGAGRYNLYADEPTRGGEWHDGVERLWDRMRRRPSALAANANLGALLGPYLDSIAAVNPDGRLHHYPGSPSIALHLLRSQDRLIACELEPRAATLLAATMRGDRRAKALTIDGWTATAAFVPPKERRGLVLIDPSFEEAADFARLASALAAAHRKWPTGIYFLWYPIKARNGPDALAKRLQKLGIAKVLRCELMTGPARSDAGLVGSGLIIVNPPHTLETELRVLAPELVRVLAPSGGQRLDWLAGERDAHFSTG